MSTTIARAKFRYNGWEDTQYAADAKSRILKFSTIYDQTIPEDKKFQKATPSGEIKMQVDNPAVLDKFGHEAIGKYFYIDFVPVD